MHNADDSTLEPRRAEEKRTAITPERWRQIRAVFDEASEHEGEARAAYLEQACHGDPALRVEVESLLAAHEQGTFFIDEPPAKVEAPSMPAERDPSDTMEIEHVGPYRLLGPLGHGGMGTVHLAVRADEAYRKQVAVKLLRRGMDSDELVRRFRSERQILANLDHPNITKLLDGGSTESGRPYLVMEYVDGIPIDAYCDQHQLDTPDRLRLFRRVCEAVHFAHQNLVVHRDLKPSNILITAEGTPKLLDFGIAKLLAPEAFEQTIVATHPGGAPMTPAYASPEQVLGHAITTASDVYALGVVLYQLITGQRPYRLEVETVEAMRRAVCEQEPERPSVAAARSTRARTRTDDARTTREEVATLQRRLRGDLDNVVMKTLRKDPRRRYASAEQLAQDLDNVLGQRPVTARPDTITYRGLLFVRRHRLAVAGATVALLVLLGFVATLMVQRRQIIEEARTSGEVEDFLVELFAIPDPTRAMGESITARQVLDRGVGNIESRLSDQPRVRAALLETMGRSYRNLGLYPEAENLLKDALELRRAVDDPGLPDSFDELAAAKIYQGDFAKAEELNRQALERRRARHGNRHVNVVDSLVALARSLQLQSKLEEAESFLGEALTTARQLGDVQTLAVTLDRQGILLNDLGAFAEAETTFREALQLLERHHGPLHPDIAVTTNNLAFSLQNQGRLDDAETLYKSAEDLQRRLYDGPTAPLAVTLNNLALLAIQRKRYEEAEACFQEVIEMTGSMFEAQHPIRARTLNNLGDLRFEQNRYPEAIGLYRQALEIRQAALGADHPAVAISLTSVARSLRLEGQLDESYALYREALEISRKHFGDRHPQVATIIGNLALVERQQGRLEEAHATYAEALEIMQSDPAAHTTLALHLYNFAAVQRSLDQPDRAEVTFWRALAAARAKAEQDDSEIGRIAATLSDFLLRRDKPTEAVELSREAFERLEHDEKMHAWVSWARTTHAYSLFVTGDYQRAVPVLTEVLAEIDSRDKPNIAQRQKVLDYLIVSHEALGHPAEAERYRALRTAA